MPQRLRTADDLIQAARPSRSDAATPGTGSGDSGVMLGKLASLRTTSTTASAAMEPPAVDAGVVTVVPEPGEQRSCLGHRRRPAAYGLIFLRPMALYSVPTSDPVRGGFATP